MPLRPRLLSLVTALAVVTVPAVPAAAAPRPAAPAAGSAAAEVVAGELLVRWAPGATRDARAAERARHGLAASGRAAVAGFEQVRVDARRDPRAIAAELARRPAVASAQPNFVYRPQATTPNDPDLGRLWGFHQSNDVDLDVPEAWSAERGSASVVVAVIDTGVQVTHPDLAANIWTNPGEIAGNGLDDDRNGLVDDVHGWDFANGDRSLYDGPEDTHGTHIAGTIAATADNGIGVAGVAPGVRVMSLKFMDADGAGSTATAIEAISYARSKGADVINASWGGPGGSGDRALRDAIAASGAVFVAAAGNQSADNDETPTSPANLDAANIVSVAGVTSRGGLASWSNHGSTTVDVGAPGEYIWSTVPGGYGYLHGTSMAVPHVAGVAALLASADAGRSASELVGVLRDAAVASPLAALGATTITGGMPNARAALAAIDALPSSGATSEPAPDGSTSTDGSTSPGGSTADAPVADDPVVTEPVTDEVVYDGTVARTLELACPSIPPHGWTDVTAASPHADGIGCATAWEVFVGGSDATFSPDSRLSRGQLASVLARAIEQATGQPMAAGTDRFSDDDDSVHAAAIDKLAAAAIVGGVDDTTYAPTAPVTRAQFAAMLARTYRHLVGSLPKGDDAFGDDDGNPHEASIDALAVLGVVTGDGRGSYDPGGVLTRAQSATMVSRLIDALAEAGAAG